MEEDVRAQQMQEAGYTDGLESFFSAGIRQFLSENEGENKVCSPINIYLELAMLAELTDGESRQQILELIGTDSVEALRTQAKEVWNAQYRNDGVTTSILANSCGWMRRFLLFRLRWKHWRTIIMPLLTRGRWDRADLTACCRTG